MNSVNSSYNRGKALQPRIILVCWRAHNSEKDTISKEEGMWNGSQQTKCFSKFLSRCKNMMYKCNKCMLAIFAQDYPNIKKSELHKVCFPEFKSMGTYPRQSIAHSFSIGPFKEIH